MLGERKQENKSAFKDARIRKKVIGGQLQVSLTHCEGK
jgi:hypothetical protein